MSDKVPKRGIYKTSHLNLFLNSSTYKDFVEFVGKLNEAAKGQDCVSINDADDTGICKIITLLTRLFGLLEKHPPLQQATRFGNPAFRTYLTQVRDASVDDMATLSELAPKELASYWWLSFGNGKRLDYGTGHEASFVVFLYVCYQIGVTTDLKNMVLCVFPYYLDLVRSIQSTYRLEPAGSHGVWSLDDYSFLPFVFGSSQLVGAKMMGSKPSSMRDLLIVDSLQEKNMYMSAIKRISDVKRGPFQEHSPLLTDISKLKSWKDVNEGLMKMFQGEVLGKFPVVQHFVFGPHFPCTWIPEEEMLESDPLSMDGTANLATLPAVVSPFDMAKSKMSQGDALTTYFGVMRRPYQPGMMAPSSSLSSEMTGFPFPKPQQQQQHQMLDSGIETHGWKIMTNKTRISSEEEVEKQIDANYTGKLDFPLPEECYSHNFVRFSHEKSGLEIEFNALDALCGCKIKKDGDGQPDRTIFQLPIADKWTNKTVNGMEIQKWRDDYDWTYTTTYTGSIKLGKLSGKEATKEEIDYELLKLKEPILFYDDVTLFDDDLFDHGQARYSVKLRVMPSCFFALARFWLRVDRTYIRCFDTRVFHVFGKDHILIEVSRKEATAQYVHEKMDSRSDDPKLLLNEMQVEKVLPEIAEKKTEMIKLA